MPHSVQTVQLRKQNQPSDAEEQVTESCLIWFLWLWAEVWYVFSVLGGLLVF